MRKGTVPGSSDGSRKGFAVFFTGLPGSGKTTLAEALTSKLSGSFGLAVTLLDGDEVRRLLSSELGFSKEHRDLNILRIGFVASEVVKHGGVAVCAAIAPYDAVRRTVRRMVGRHGGFVLVHVSTPLSVCEARDPKGLYAKARAGLLSAFTGISDPYEEPAGAEVVIDTTHVGPVEGTLSILDGLSGLGLLDARSEASV